jgi:hypothetical protein
MARVQVSDETCAAYRAAWDHARQRRMGRLVEREVASHRRRTAVDADGGQVAVEDAREAAKELATLIARLERGSNGSVCHFNGWGIKSSQRAAHRRNERQRR